MKENRKITTMIIIISIILLAIIFGGCWYFKADHYVKTQEIGEYEFENDLDDYYFIYNQKELEHFEQKTGIHVELDGKYNFDQKAILVCAGHELINCYYNVESEDSPFKTTHFLYVILKKEKNDKLYLYSISKNYTSWRFSEKYYEDFTGIIYK